MIIIVLANVFNNKDDKREKSIKVEKEIEWTTAIGVMVTMIIIGFMLVIALTYNMPREDNNYMSIMAAYFLFLCFALFVIFIHLLKGMTLNFGHHFKRHIFIHDPKTGKNHYIDDDGLNNINNNGTLTGRITE